MANQTEQDAPSPTDVIPEESSKTPQDQDKSQIIPPPSIVVTRLRRSSSLESRDNPFQPDGELSREAEELLRRSTISRNQVIIDDPEKSSSDIEGAITPSNLSAVEASPDNQTDANQNEAVRPADIKLNNSGPREGEVGVINKNEENSLHVEHVKLKEKKKCQCCVVM